MCFFSANLFVLSTVGGSRDRSDDSVILLKFHRYILYHHGGSSRSNSFFFCIASSSNRFLFSRALCRNGVVLGEIPSFSAWSHRDVEILPCVILSCWEFFKGIAFFLRRLMVKSDFLQMDVAVNFLSGFRLRSVFCDCVYTAVCVCIFDLAHC